MTFTESVSSCFRKYVTFSGRAARSEYWWFILFTALVGFVLGFADAAIFGSDPTEASPLTSIFSLIIFLPTISVQVRRLHDLDKSGWWYWIALIPLIGAIILFVWNISGGTLGDNRFGPSTRNRRPKPDSRPPSPPRERPVKERESNIPAVKRNPTIRRR